MSAGIAKLEAHLPDLAAAPVPPRSAVDLAAPAANDAPALAPAPPVVATGLALSAATVQPEYMTTREAAAVRAVSVKGLEALRARGKGPAFVRVGKAVRYRREICTAPGESGGQAPVRLAPRFAATRGTVRERFSARISRGFVVEPTGIEPVTF